MAARLSLFAALLLVLFVLPALFARWHPSVSPVPPAAAVCIAPPGVSQPPAQEEP